MTVRWIALRLLRELVRDRRTMAFLLVVPVLVMTLIYHALAEDEVARLGVVTRGAARLFAGDLLEALATQEDVTIVPTGIADEEIRDGVIVAAIRERVRSGALDAVLYLDQELIPERFEGREGTLHVFVEGTRPTLTTAVMSAVAGSMDDLAAALPVVIDPSCSAMCADSVNVLPMVLEKHYLYGNEDYRLVDFFLPVMPPFFVFFFTFILATVSFQRERVRGTLERLMVAPVSFVQVILGYVLGFIGFALVQSAIIVAFFTVLLSFPLSAVQIAALFVPVLLTVLVALALGLLASFLAHNEFQALQFIPVVILPQLFLADIIWSIDGFPPLFRVIARALPLTYANRITRSLLIRGQPLWVSWPDLVLLFGFFAATIAVLMVVGRRSNRAL